MIWVVVRAASASHSLPLWYALSDAPCIASLLQVALAPKDVEEGLA